MTTLKIPHHLDEALFRTLSDAWNAATDASIDIDDLLESRERNALVRFLLNQLPNDLAFSLLSTLSEEGDVEDDLLEQQFDRGDVACKVSVCLRDRLSAKLEEKCATSSIAEVREHFLSKRAL